jgi:DNA-3-methyladenine glycosylase
MPREELVGHAPEVAPALLGALLVVGDRAGRIVEVEAYGGADDPASHAHRGRNARNASMFGGAGTLYCYRSHGLHTCANVVTGRPGDPQAVLVRAVEPLRGISGMWGDRPRARREVELTNGPGKLCAALGIALGHDGTDLCAPGAAVQLHLGERVPADLVVVSTRVGVTRAVERPWRFHVAGSAFVSRPRSAAAPADGG